MSSAPERLFTLDEANALLPRVRELVETLQGQASKLQGLQERLEAFRERKRRGDGVVEGEARLVQDALREADRIGGAIRELLQELHGVGCELKDVRMGLVDFRSRREDRTVYLCWRLGEDEIRYWHELSTGFEGRQPL